MDSGQCAGNECVHRQTNVTCYVQDEALGLGVLSVEESFLRWTSEDQSRDVCLEYPNISIHGICRDTTVFPHSCVYVLHCVPIESDLEEEKEGVEEEEEEEGEEEAPLAKTEEIRFVPADEHQLEAIYEAISECQLLYPDSQVSEGEDGEEEPMLQEEEEGREEGDYFTTPEGFSRLTVEGKAVLEHLEKVFKPPTEEEFAQMAEHIEEEGQFEDAD